MLGVFITCISPYSKANTSPKKVGTILILGDSLSAEYGLIKNSGWVYLLTEKLAKKNSPVKIVNSSISGETTAGGLARLERLIDQYKPNLIIIELGGNDALRGLELDVTKANLKKMVEISQRSNSEVLLLGMKIPTNYGKRYSQDFQKIYGEIASSTKVKLVPFFLENVAENPNLFQADRIHPNEKAQKIMVENVWIILKNML